MNLVSRRKAAKRTRHPARRARLRPLLGVVLGASAALVTTSVTPGALGFPHVVRQGETLARIAEQTYGKIQLERVIATANGLDGPSAPPLAPGMILELPALTYHRVHEGETWESLSTELLGADHRAPLLAETNGHKPWIQPTTGQVVRIPYNLPWTLSGEESLATLAYRFLGSTKRAFALAQYNDLEDQKLDRGRFLLVPLSDLPLTAEGERSAREAARRIDEQAAGTAFDEQQKAGEQVRVVAQDVRGGRYVLAVSRASALLAGKNLPLSDVAHLHRLVLESAVALEVASLAEQACRSYVELEPEPDLDPTTTSPKILRACERAPRKAPAPDAPSPPTSSDEEEP